MIIDKNFPGIAQLANETYVYNGNLIADEDITIDLDAWLTVRGSVICNGNLIVKKQITVFGDMMATGDIKADELSVQGTTVAGGVVKNTWYGMNSIRSNTYYEGHAEGFFEAKAQRIIFIKSAIFHGSAFFVCRMKKCAECCSSTFFSMANRRNECIQEANDYILGKIKLEDLQEPEDEIWDEEG